MRYLFTCKSLTFAQRASRLLERSGIYNGIVKSPAELSKGGCGYSIAVRMNHGSRASALLKSNELLGKIYIQNDDGTYMEAEL